jgi:hypothetical protein
MSRTPKGLSTEALTRGFALEQSARLGCLSSVSSETPNEPSQTTLGQAGARGRQTLIRRIYEVDPLVCPRCAGEMRVVGFITQPVAIKRILDHLRERENVSRPPPHALQPTASPA